MSVSGVVLSDQGSQVVVDVEGTEYACVIRKALRRGRRSKPVAPGDRVDIEQSGDGWAVERVHERKSLISRRDPSHKHREQILVANLDAVLIVAAAKSPDLVPGVVDRFLVAAESRELDAAIVINKVDLDPAREFAPVAEVYAGLGYEVVEASATAGTGLEAVRALLKDKETALLGHSGVGKSSLANALDDSLSLTVGPVHASTGLGTHTTSAVSLLRLPWGGYLVDTPGIREFGLARMEPIHVGPCFREIAARAADCRFNDCLHEREPDCAVKAAVDDGSVTRWRYESYLRILESLR
jgi:ribosome biogenesis GTPase